MTITPKWRAHLTLLCFTTIVVVLCQVINRTDLSAPSWVRPLLIGSGTVFCIIAWFMVTPLLEEAFTYRTWNRFRLPSIARPDHDFPVLWGPTVPSCTVSTSSSSTTGRSDPSPSPATSPSTTPSPTNDTPSD